MSTPHRHLILIGPPGAGKSVVGRLVAADLGARLVDIDQEIMMTTGPISRIFAEQGEEAFRAMERQAMSDALGAPPQVIVSGGGWAAQPGALESAAEALVIHLKTSPEAAARRLAQSRTKRPLLGDDPLEPLIALLETRLPFYNRAGAEVTTDDRTPAAVAVEVARLARQLAGWS